MLKWIWAALAAVCLAAAPATAETWYRADTDNFVLYSTGSRDDLRDWSLKFERFDALMRALYHVSPEPSPNRLTIYLLEDGKDVMQAYNGHNYGFVAGFYSDDIEGSYAVTQRTHVRRGELSGQEVMFHEYAHHFMYRYFPYAYPGWYREGFAEYYATTEFDDEGNWTYGKPPLYRGADLISPGHQLSVEKMLTTKESDLSDEEAYEIYTRGWLLVHMLHSDPEMKRKLNTFLLDVARGTNKAEAAVDAFGDLDALEKQLTRYMGESPAYVRGRTSIPYDGRMDIVELDDIDSEYEALRLANRRSGDRTETLEGLRDLAERAPDRPYILAELADAQHKLSHQLAWDRARDKAGKDVDNVDLDIGPLDMRAALATIDRALALAPDDSRVNALKAEFLIDVAGNNAGDVLWTQARDHAIAANRANPDDPFPLKLYYDSYARSGERVDPMARSALERAFVLAPEVSDLRVEYALDLALQGEFDRAVDVVEFLTASPHSERVGKLALKQIAALRSGSPYVKVADMKLSKEEQEGED